MCQSTTPRSESQQGRLATSAKTPIAFAGFLLLLIAAGCATSSVKHGNQIDEARVEMIQKGKTTTTEILNWFGSPTSRTTSSNGTTFVFMGNESRSKMSLLGAYGIGDASSSTTQTKMLTVTTRDGIVVDYSFSVQ